VAESNKQSRQVSAPPIETLADDAEDEDDDGEELGWELEEVDQLQDD
jgi:hypothetical protein